MMVPNFILLASIFKLTITSPTLPDSPKDNNHLSKIRPKRQNFPLVATFNHNKDFMQNAEGAEQPNPVGELRDAEERCLSKEDDDGGYYAREASNQDNNPRVEESLRDAAAEEDGDYYGRQADQNSAVEQIDERETVEAEERCISKEEDDGYGYMRHATGQLPPASVHLKGSSRPTKLEIYKKNLALPKSEGNLRQALGELQTAQELLNSFELKQRAAGPHLHHHLHGHHISQLNSGIHHQQVPNVNLNINQNQQFHSSAFPHQTPPLHNQHFAQSQVFAHTANPPVYHHNQQPSTVNSGSQQIFASNHGGFAAQNQHFAGIRESENERLQDRNKKSFVSSHTQTDSKWTTTVRENDHQSNDSEDKSSSRNREAKPTFHKLKNKKVIYVPQYYPSYGHQSYQHGSYREAGEQGNKGTQERFELDDDVASAHYGDAADQMLQQVEDTMAEQVASPHLKEKLKKKKIKTMIFYPMYDHDYDHYSHGYYREADNSRDNVDENENNMEMPSDAETVTSPHLKEKLAKKKIKTMMFYPMTDYGYQHYGHQSYDREANGDDEDIPLNVDLISNEAGPRAAHPTFHKLKQKKMKKVMYHPGQYPSYGSHYRAAYDDEKERDSSIEDKVSSSFLINVPSRIFREQYKRSLDEKDSSRKISKRSIPLTRLYSDPNVKLDVPKTFENLGSAAKNAFEDEHAPMYHLKHLIGSSKNALLSALRIPPQNMIIPSDYEIIKNNDLERDTSKDEENMPEFSRTFNQVGNIIRNSIKSGQDTAAHLGDMAHEARNIIHTAKHAAPKLIIPYSQIPAIQNTRLRSPSKAILITPRVVDLSEGAKKEASSKSNFVELSHLMDATGISTPTSKNLGLQKIIFEPRALSQARVDRKLAQLYSRFKTDDAVGMGEAVNALENAKVSVGARNLREFLVKMRNELSTMVQNHPKPTKSKLKLQKVNKQATTKEMRKFIETLFDKNKEAEVRNTKEAAKDEIIGSGLFLPPQLLHPFMDRPSKSELEKFLIENGDLGEDSDGANKRKKINKREDVIINEKPLEYDDSIVGAINPLMMERFYNATVEIKNAETPRHEDLFGENAEVTKDEEKLGITMNLGHILIKPFMGAEAQQENGNSFDLSNMNNSNKSVQED